jgi:hypothetical protein
MEKRKILSLPGIELQPSSPQSSAMPADLSGRNPGEPFQSLELLQ